MDSEIKTGATYRVEVVAPDGTASQHSVEHNLVPMEGLNHMAAVIFKAGTQVNPWFIAPFEGVYTPTGNETAATIAAAAQESTAYGAAARLEFVEGAVTAGAVDNTANKAEFVFNASKVLRGVFIVSASPKGATTGTLISVVRFSSPKTVDSGSTLRVTAGFAFASV
ncbi:hypothetical protein J2W32_004478 [Variovorax boronicumulans]|uniref:Phage tail protein n=1 Tax=Variovorax boronicumulans TaxID=436515 RepID=A0AAW8D2B2_9BURK|nr:hypothetical protein [Variovorax boronicumulans]MDP9895380.1 hypothetical protein [Variovorax boronicumulans]MDQ0055420.1 hypothetical protein [Variovorax boronicumulans]